MDRSTLKRCLILFSTVKKTLLLNPIVEEGWYQSLLDLNEERGIEAFNELMKHPPMGDLEPGHVLNKAKELRTYKVMAPSLETPWISTAQKYQGEKDYQEPSKEFKAFLTNERRKNYKAIKTNYDKSQEIVLTKNPDCWDWYFNDLGELTYIRPYPVTTGEKVTKQTFDKRFDKTKHFE